MSKAAITQRVKIIVPAGKASPSPPVGPALGARGVKAMDFCKEFNARTAHLKTDVPTPTSITIAPDRTFTFDFRTPPTVWLLKKAANMPIGAAPPSKAKTELSLKHIYAIAQVKMMDADLAAVGERAVVKQIIGTAKTLGLTVVA